MRSSFHTCGFTPFTGNERRGVARMARSTDVLVACAAAPRTWRSMSLLAPIACCVVMQRTLGAAIERVVSEPSPFGRSLLRVDGVRARRIGGVGDAACGSAKGGNGGSAPMSVWRALGAHSNGGREIDNNDRRPARLSGRLLHRERRELHVDGCALSVPQNVDRHVRARVGADHDASDVLGMRTGFSPTRTMTSPGAMPARSAGPSRLHRDHERTFAEWRRGRRHSEPGAGDTPLLLERQSDGLNVVHRYGEAQCLRIRRCARESRC